MPGMIQVTSLFNADQVRDLGWKEGTGPLACHHARRYGHAERCQVVERHLLDGRKRVGFHPGRVVEAPQDPPDLLGGPATAERETPRAFERKVSLRPCEHGPVRHDARVTFGAGARAAL